MTSDKAIGTVMTMTDAMNLKPATEMVRANNAHVLNESTAYRQARGQDSHDAPDMSALWVIPDTTPEGRGSDWYPKLRYGQD